MNATTPEIEQLTQIAEKPIWDGNLISKSARDALYRAGLVIRHSGWNSLSEQGISTCCTLGILRS